MNEQMNEHTYVLGNERRDDEDGSSWEATGLTIKRNKQKEMNKRNENEKN